MQIFLVIVIRILNNNVPSYSVHVQLLLKGLLALAPSHSHNLKSDNLLPVV